MALINKAGLRRLRSLVLHKRRAAHNDDAHAPATRLTVCPREPVLARSDLTVWAAATIPMAVLAWAIAPLLGALLGGGNTAFIMALLLCITAGLIWQFVLTLVLVRREQGTLRWERVRDAL